METNLILNSQNTINGDLVCGASLSQFEYVR